MRGHAATPDTVVDLMVEALFSQAPPRADDRLLDPGCGEGSFIAGVLRFCDRNGLPIPRITGVELDPTRLHIAAERFSDVDAVELVEGDFLADCSADRHYRFIIGNPPYVGLPALLPDEREQYRTRFRAARGRFDLYFLFFERALELLAHDGRMAFVTPEKYLYVEAASALRALLTERAIERIELLPERTFTKKIAYPCVTVLSATACPGTARCRLRDGTEHLIDRAALSSNPWWGTIQGPVPLAGGASTPGDAPMPLTLSDVTERISAGVATGADAIFVQRRHIVPHSLLPVSYPTISGRELRHGVADEMPPLGNVMLVPYHMNGELLEEDELGELGTFLNRTDIRCKLENRYCARYKPWYAFHDSVPMQDLLQPKILCKDICAQPRFWIDHKGDVIPRHSVYYIVPKTPELLDPLAEWLNGHFAREWLEANCHRAANGFLRLQTRTLARLPISETSQAFQEHAACVA